MAKQKKTNSSGGKAEATGANYETLVGAWYCHWLLFGKSIQPPFDLPASTELIAVRCQTDAPVDDVNAETADRGIIFVQAKRTVSLSDAASSALLSTLNQFVSLYKACEERAAGKAWARPLDPARDRLVLATRGESSAKIRDVLPDLLERLRAQDSASLVSVSTSAAERAVAQKVEKALKRAWKAIYKSAPTAQQMRAVLKLVWVHQLDLESGKRDRKFLLDQLRANALVDKTQASAALAELYQLVARMRAARSRIDRGGVMSALRSAAIKLQALPDYRDDISALRRWTESRLSKAPVYTRLLEIDPTLVIERAVWPSFNTAAKARSFLLVGDPGAGKSGLMYRLAVDALAEQRDVVFLPCDLLNADGFAALNAELGLSRDIADVLLHWPGDAPGLIILDALDAARKPETQRILREVVRVIMASTGGRWRVIASVRKYDLRQGTEWARMFEGSPPIAENVAAEFAATAHVAVVPLTDAEVEQMATAFPELLALFQAADTKLRELLRNIFNLHLLSDLLKHGVALSSLSSIRTQPELLDKYWLHRIRQDDGKHDDRELALSVIVEAMIGSQSLQATRAAITPKVDTSALVDLERNDILRAEDRQGLVNEAVLLFSHHVLFDYAVARLTFQRGRHPTQLVQLLNSRRELALMLAPSLSLTLADVWSLGGARAEFWNLAFALAVETALPGVAQLAAPMIAAELAADIADFSPLIAALSQPATQVAAEKFVPRLIGAAFVRTQSGMPLIGDGAGPWMQLAEALTATGNDDVIFPVRNLLATALDGL